MPTSKRHHKGQTLIPFTPTEGQGMMIIHPKDLNIVWGEDKRYWDVPMEENMAAKLRGVAWLEISSSVKDINPNKDYEVGFSLSFGSDEEQGWDDTPIFVMVKRGKQGRFTWKKSIFNPRDARPCFDFTTTLNKEEISRQDPNLQLRELYFGLYEVWSFKNKTGLMIHHAFVKELP